ncbi:hypothetical protein H0266_15305 [Halobacillus locisalis]|uniref:Uncharacterized protein n=1 Tax=Halobacillus locisalis TaxID=220753 RepID=A0A838CWG1_9BACI|nr:hypothetical protein [Halobacillus locisalis]MBA2176264.1 hypothetical protein [Halobacillus locisalis]
MRKYTLIILFIPLFLSACSDHRTETIGPKSIEEILEEYPDDVTQVTSFPFDQGESLGYIIKWPDWNHRSLTLRYYAEGVEADYEHPFNVTGEAVEYIVGTKRNLINEIEDPGSLESYEKIQFDTQEVYYQYFSEGNGGTIVWWDGQFERTLAYLEAPEKLEKSEFRTVLRDLYEDVLRGS